MNAPTESSSLPPLDVRATLAGKRLVVIGATGFLGKVWLSVLLHHYPEIERLYVVVRPKTGLTPEERFWAEVAPSPVFDPIREQHPGAAYEAFLREKIQPIPGDVSNEWLGFPDDLRDEMRGKLSAIVNVAGVVDFNPPLDDALDVNAFGAQNLVATARDLGDTPIFHTSTCYVAGCRSGVTPERNTLEFPFPRADELDVSHWDPEREIAECIDLVQQTRRRVEDAPRQSHLLDEAKRNLERRGEPQRGKALDDELKDVKKRFVKKRLVDAGFERATFWGWPNIYTYTKSIGEQVFLSSGLDICIARPAIIESAVAYPKVGWCEGINTTSPFIYLALKGIQHFQVSEHSYLDLIPVDRCAFAMVAGVAALIARRNPTVFQICTSDKNPVKTKRFAELIGLSKRRFFKDKSSGNQLVNMLAAHTEPMGLVADQYERRSAPAVHKHAKTLANWLGLAKGTQIERYAKPVQKQLEGMSRQAGNVAKLYNEFKPFTHDVEFRFSAKNTRALMATLTEADQALLPWDVESIDWRHYWLEVQMPGWERWSKPLLDDRLKKDIKPQRRHDNLVTMLEDRLEFDEHHIVLHALEGEELTNISYRDLWELSAVVAARLAAAGVGKGDRVALGGRNHPDWAVAYFGILRAGATAVPVDKEYEAFALSRVLEVSKSKIAILDDQVVELDEMPCPRWELHHTARDPDAGEVADAPALEIGEEDIASILYTSGTTGDPKGVMLSHANFTALVAALAPLFPLDHDDRMVSVLPLHHTFEFTCGLLLPLARGARVVYLDEVNGDRLTTALKVGRATAMVGVPALWELLERRIHNRVAERGKVAETVFDVLLDFNRSVGKNLGFDLGRLLFGTVHRELGGNLRTLISGAAALPKDVHKTFQGLGLHLAEGYGLTEAAPVLTVAKASPRAKAGKVGKAIPGIEIKIEAANDDGVGEVLARGPNVMRGYADNEAATQASLDAEGWLHTGDLGRLDKKGRLEIVGRSKEVILTTSGENVYPDDVENLLGNVKYVEELSIVGLPDDKGTERVACLAVPTADDEVPRKELHERAEKELRKAIEKLPRGMRPTVLRISDAELPRTSTRKVKRKEVIAYLERVAEASSAAVAARRDLSGGSSVVRSAVAALAKKPAAEIRPEHDLAADLGFDSLMVVELLSALEEHGRGVDPQKLTEAKTVGELEAIISAADRRAGAEARGASKTSQIEKDEDEGNEVPDLVKDPAKRVLAEGQFRFYHHVMRAKVRGKANIPHNRHTLVVANHASHIDMGLVKYALGSYGTDLVALAAEDYFFKPGWRRFYVENFTNMAPLDRTSGLRKTLRQAGEQLAEGKTVLIFPEGTRVDDGKLREFMPVIGHLALNHQVDILPLWLGNTAKAFPKGSVIPVPRQRKVEVRIGPAIRVGDMDRHCEGLKRADRYRKVAKMAHAAVAALRDGHQIDYAREAITAAEGDAPSVEVVTSASKKASPMTTLFQDLEARFVPGSVEKETSFYFSLGDSSDGKWNLVLRNDAAVFNQGKPAGGTADCVLKTSPEIFTKIVKESYTPSVAEFMAGKVKSNDIQLLQVFQKAFGL